VIKMIESVNEQSILSNIKVSKLLVIDTSTQEGLTSKKQLFDSVNVDLSDPKNNVVFLYQMFFLDEVKSEYPSVEIWGVVETTAEWAVVLYQDSINNVYEKIWDELSDKPSENPPSIPLNGVFDCNTASATLLPAQMARGTGVGKVDYWPLGRLEFNWCLSNSSILADMIEYNNQEINADTFNITFQPRFQVNVPEDNFVGISIPEHCEGIKPTEMVVGTKSEGKQQDWVWPIFLGTMSGVILIGMAYYAFSDKFKTPEMEY